MSDFAIGQQPVDQLPWGTNIVLLTKLNDRPSREWYARRALEEGWSRNILELQIEAGLIDREGRAPNNFNRVLPPDESDMAVQIFKDPYLFDFIGTDIPRRELELEHKLTEHIEEFLLELGKGFAFVGRQVPLSVGGEQFYADMLFYHLKLRCFVVIELKACDFQPAFIAQLNLYRTIVDKTMRHPSDGATIGLLLVKGKNDVVVEYALDGMDNPIGVAEWRRALKEGLPEDLESDLPTIEEIECEMSLFQEGGSPKRH